MVNLLRTYQRPLMIVVTVVIIIAFGLLYNNTQLDRIAADRAYQIYGRALKQAEVERAARRFQLAQALGLNEMIMGLAGQARSQDEAVENFVWNSFVLSKEATQLGIQPSVEAAANRMRELPGLQTNGQFDPRKYQEFIQNVLLPNGFTSAQLEDLIIDDLNMKELMTLVGSTVDVSPKEFDTLYQRRLEKTHTSIVRFDLATFVQSAEPTEEQIKKYFDEHTASLKTEERRVVSFVEITLTDEEQKLTGRERMEAFSKKAEIANDFGQELIKDGATFGSVAEKMNLEVVTVGEFSLSQPPSALAAFPQAAAIAFQLTESARDSNPFDTENGVMILHLDKVIPSEPLPLEEARPRIIAALKQEEARNNLTAKANEVRTKIEAALKSGSSLTDAAQTAGVSIESFPAFSLSEPSEQSGGHQIAEATLGLPVGVLSRVVPTPEGALLVYVDKRDPVNAATMDNVRAAQLPAMREFKRYAVFADWLRGKLEAANPRSLRPPAEAEYPQG